MIQKEKNVFNAISTDIANFLDLPAKMLLQVHDELLFEVREEYCEDLIAKVQSIMEEASLPFLKMDIPLSVDAGRGMNWAEAH